MFVLFFVSVVAGIVDFVVVGVGGVVVGVGFCW